MGTENTKSIPGANPTEISFLHEITAKQITDESVDAFMMEDRWVDYQMVFSQRFQLTRRISLEEALGRADIDPEGRFHDGLNDAVNTGLLIEKLELSSDYQLVSYEMPEKPSEHLSSSLWRTICRYGA